MYIFMTYYQNAGQNRNMKVACKPIKYMAEFKHLGMTLRNVILQDFRRKWNLGSTHSITHFSITAFPSPLRNLKKKYICVYITEILSALIWMSFCAEIYFLRSQILYSKQFFIWQSYTQLTCCICTINLLHPKICLFDPQHNNNWLEYNIST